MVISRVITRVTPFRALITLLTTYLLSPLPLQVPSPQITYLFQDLYEEIIVRFHGVQVRVNKGIGVWVQRSP